MKIFISWSGEISNQIAEKINDWLPTVLQSIKPYFTPSSIEKGNRWSVEVSKNLEECKMGIIILTKENLSSPWIMFEAGALSKAVDDSKVIPLLFGIEKSDIKGPLTQFQASAFTKIEVKKLIKSINSELGERKLPEKTVEKVFNKMWGDLEQEIKNIKIVEKETDQEIRKDRDLLEEILARVRYTAKRLEVGNNEQKVGRLTYHDSNKLMKLLCDFIESFEAVFHEDWAYTKENLNSDSMEFYVRSHGTFIEPKVNNESNNWATRGGLLNSYRNLKEFIDEYSIDVHSNWSDWV